MAIAVVACAAVSRAQDQHDHTTMPGESGWMLMQDGVVFAEYNHQGGPRGGDELVAPNWWMGTASRDTSAGRLTFNAMLSLDAMLFGEKGYRELFQAGEAVDGKPLIDRQHPHDVFMQLAAIWRVPVTDAVGFTLAGGPAGEPALGPVAFMHRASAADNRPGVVSPERRVGGSGVEWTPSEPRRARPGTRRDPVDRLRVVDTGKRRIDRVRHRRLWCQ
jgi:hypothetical protein